jgi:hypothetical protein
LNDPALLLRDLDEDDSVLIALAGHGVQFRGDDESYFCPADARLADKSTLIPLSVVCRALEASGAAKAAIQAAHSAVKANTLVPLRCACGRTEPRSCREGGGHLKLRACGTASPSS